MVQKSFEMSIEECIEQLRLCDDRDAANARDRTYILMHVLQLVLTQLGHDSQQSEDE